MSDCTAIKEWFYIHYPRDLCTFSLASDNRLNMVPYEKECDDSTGTLPWVPEIFSRVTSVTCDVWRGASSELLRPQAGDTSGEAARKSFSRGLLFKTWPKPETAHEKSLRAPRVPEPWSNRNCWLMIWHLLIIWRQGLVFVLLSRKRVSATHIVNILKLL